MASLRGRPHKGEHRYNGYCVRKANGERKKFYTKEGVAKQTIIEGVHF